MHLRKKCALGVVELDNLVIRAILRNVVSYTKMGSDGSELKHLVFKDENHALIFANTVNCLKQQRMAGSQREQLLSLAYKEGKLSKGATQEEVDNFAT